MLSLPVGILFSTGLLVGITLLELGIAYGIPALARTLIAHLGGSH